MAPRGSTNHIVRKVFFSKVTTAAGLPVTDFNWPKEVVPLTTNTQTRRKADSNGHWIRLSTSSVEYPLRFTLTKNRQKGLPKIGHAETGQTRSLQLKDGEGLDETTHFVVLKDGWIVHEYNHFGPRIEMLAQFLRPTSFDRLGLEIRNAVKSDLLESLGSGHQVIALRMKASSRSFKQSGPIPGGLGTGLRSIAAESQADTIEVSIRRSHRGRGSPPPLGVSMDSLRKMARWMVQEPEATLDTTFWNDKERRREHINLLSERIVTTRKLVLDNPTSRAVDSESAFDELESAHESLAVELAGAAFL